MKRAYTDYTYCTNNKCKNKCKRNIQYYQFEKNTNYSFCYFDENNCIERGSYYAKKC